MSLKFSTQLKLSIDYAVANASGALNGFLGLPTAAPHDQEDAFKEGQLRGRTAALLLAAGRLKGVFQSMTSNSLQLASSGVAALEVEGVAAATPSLGEVAWAAAISYMSQDTGDSGGDAAGDGRDAPKGGANKPRNSHLAGKRHPRTDVPFDDKGYPDFSKWRHAEVK